MFLARPNHHNSTPCLNTESLKRLVIENGLNLIHNLFLELISLESTTDLAILCHFIDILLLL